MKTKPTEANCRAGFGGVNDLVFTPKPLYEWLHKQYHFDFDPCPANPTFDGLKVEWGKSNYVNPPYSDVERWLEKAVIEYKKGKKIALLIPFRPHRRYWFKHVFPHAASILIPYQGVTFQGYKHPPPFTVSLVLFGHGKARKNRKYKEAKWASDSKCIKL